MTSAPSYLLLSAVLFAFSFALSLPAAAQVNGVPPSISSMGFGGSAALNHVAPPSVTSLSSYGHGNSSVGFGSCCSNFFWPASPTRSGFSGRRHRGKDKDEDHTDFPVGIVEPVYIPYAEPYAPETDNDSVNDPSNEPAEDDSATSLDPQYFYPFVRAVRNYVERPAGLYEAETEDPVAPQPSTVLVFKDGRQYDVLNYAIVGNTLFDFSSERTRKILLADLDVAATQKANDDRGVDFQIPANIACQ